MLEPTLFSSHFATAEFMEDRPTNFEEQARLRRRSGPILIILALAVPLGTAILVSLINDTRHKSHEAAFEEALSKKKAEEAKQLALIKKLKIERRALIVQLKENKKQADRKALSRQKAIAQGQIKKNGKPISLEALDMDLKEVVNLISKNSGLHVLLDAGVAESVTVALRDIPGRKALEVVAKLTHCEIEEIVPGILILTQAPRVTLEFNQANIHTVLQVLAVYSGKSIIIDQNIGGTVSLSVEDVLWDVAISALAKTCQFHAQQNKGIIILSQTPFKKPWGTELGQKTTLPESKTLTLNKTATLSELAKTLSKVSDKPVFVKDETDKKITVKLGTLPWRHALNFLAKLSQREVVETEDHYALLSVKDNFFIAQNVQSSHWIAALSALMETNTVSKTKLSSRFTGQFNKVSAQGALQATAHSLQLTLEENDGVLSLRPQNPEQHQDSKKESKATVITAAGRKHPLRLEATLGNQLKRFAIISGRSYRSKEILVDENEEPLAVRIAKIEAGLVTLNIYDKGGKKIVRTIELGFPKD